VTPKPSEVSGPDGADDGESTREPGVVLDALGDVDARRILRSADDPKTVAQLADELGISRSAASQRLDAAALDLIVDLLLTTDGPARR